MRAFFKKPIFIFFSICLLASCAKRGTIYGGAKDTIPPVLRISFPKNYNTNFSSKEIKLTFDEIIKVKDISKQLIISPPMNNEPIITPEYATRVLTIKIKDTLKPNTTYSFNFGQSIADNNEGNVLNQFKYVFSTGAVIDSLKLSGSIKDAFDKKTDNFVSVMLYEANEKFNDSIVYKEKPRYITNTLDSAKIFSIENIKAGKYLLVAMKDYNNNAKFDAKKDKIAFQKQLINIPNDSLFEMNLFKETPDFKAERPSQASGNRIIMGHQGKIFKGEKMPKVVLKNGDEVLPTIVTRFPQKDSIQIWYKTIKTDSLALSVSQQAFQKDFYVKVKNQKKDTLSIKTISGNTLKLKDAFKLETSVPIVKIDTSRIKIFDSKNKQIAFTYTNDIENQQLLFDFKKQESEKYTLKLLDKALTDFNDKTNDTLNYSFNTLTPADYGNLKIILQGAKAFPLIIELTNAKGDVLVSSYTEKETMLYFDLIEPEKYTFRLIYDTNKNKRFDSGNYLKKQQPEKVFYFEKEIEVRANWDVEQIIDLEP
jgi:Bacterial Ig-like domain